MNAFWDRWRKPLASSSKPSRTATGGLTPDLVDHVQQVLAAAARP